MKARGKVRKIQAPASKAAPIPLADLTVQWPEREAGEDKVYTVTGDTLARLLAWSTKEGIYPTTDAWPGPAGENIEDLRRLARLVQAASESEEVGGDVDVFWFLRRLMEDFLQRAQVASHTAAQLLRDAVVTVGPARALKPQERGTPKGRAA